MKVNLPSINVQGSRNEGNSYKIKAYLMFFCFLMTASNGNCSQRSRVVRCFMTHSYRT